MTYKIAEYKKVKTKSKCEKCGKTFTYEAKAYKLTGKIIRERTVCDECQGRRNRETAEKHRERKNR